MDLQRLLEVACQINGMFASFMVRLKKLEDENRRLKAEIVKGIRTKW